MLFEEDASAVALINKKRPKWQSGQWNGIGGAIEEQDGWLVGGSVTPEIAHRAMVREFEEEAGARHEQWTLFCLYYVNNGRDVVWFFRASCHHAFASVKTMTDERVALFETFDLPRVIPNLRWLIPMAASVQFHPLARPLEIFE